MARLAPHERVQWIDKQMVEMFSGKEEFLTQAHELKMQLDDGRSSGAEIRDLGPEWRSRCGEWWVDPCLLFNEQICVLMEEKKDYAAALDVNKQERVFNSLKVSGSACVSCCLWRRGGFPQTSA